MWEICYLHWHLLIVSVAMLLSVLAFMSSKQCLRTCERGYGVIWDIWVNQAKTQYMSYLAIKVSICSYSLKLAVSILNKDWLFIFWFTKPLRSTYACLSSHKSDWQAAGSSAHWRSSSSQERERERRNICANILPIAFRLRSNISRATLMIILCGDLVLRIYCSCSIWQRCIIDFHQRSLANFQTLFSAYFP